MPKYAVPDGVLDKDWCSERVQVPVCTWYSIQYRIQFAPGIVSGIFCIFLKNV